MGTHELLAAAPSHVPVLFAQAPCLKDVKRAWRVFVTSIQPAYLAEHPLRLSSSFAIAVTARSIVPHSGDIGTEGINNAA